jgi:hypothetical protein
MPSTPSFPWLDTTPPRGDGPARRDRVACDELAQRAALLYRLGFSEQAATARLRAKIAWEYDPACGATRPAALSDDAITRIVAATYARRPGGAGSGGAGVPARRRD